VPQPTKHRKQGGQYKNKGALGGGETNATSKISWCCVETDGKPEQKGMGGERKLTVSGWEKVVALGIKRKRAQGWFLFNVFLVWGVTALSERLFADS